MAEEGVLLPLTKNRGADTPRREVKPPRSVQEDSIGGSHFSIIELRAQKSHFLQAHSICRKPAAERERVNAARL